MFLVALLTPLLLSAQRVTPSKMMVPVEKGVSLEVLDWGGTGRALVLLEGLGGVAGDYDSFAPFFTAHNHVYGITRRGFGASSKPAPTPANYSAARLGQDVLNVIDFLKLDRPVLAGQSIAGEELSWIGIVHPDRVAGLIYLEGVDSYSFYDPERTDMVMDMVSVRRQIDAFEAGEPLSATVLGRIRDSAADLSRSAGRMAFNVAVHGGPGDPAPPPAGLAIKFGEQEFTAAIRAPILAIMACPHDYGEPDSRAAAILRPRDLERCVAQIQFLRAHDTTAQVVVIPNADHQLLRTSQTEVVPAMRAFLATLK